MKTEIIVASFIVAYIFAMGWLLGTFHGYNQSDETHNRVECELDFGYKPQSEIPGRCLKYFKK